MYHALSFISPQQGFSSQPLWQSCPRGNPWSSQWQCTRECSCSPWSSGTCQRLPPTRFQEEWEPPSCQLKGVAVDSGLGKPVPWHQHWESLTTTKPQFCKIITYSPQPQLPKLLLPSDRSPRPAASSNPDFFSAGSFSTMCRNGLINLSSTLMIMVLVHHIFENDPGLWKLTNLLPSDLRINTELLHLQSAFLDKAWSGRRWYLDIIN